MSDLESLLSSYDYPLEPKQIATEPASPRDSSRLLIYDTKSEKTVIDSYLHLDRYLPKGALLVFNDTKVIPARLIGHLKTGGKIEFLCTGFATDAFFALSERGLANGEKVWLTKKHSVTVLEKMGKEYRLAVPSDLDIKKQMSRRGVTPLPPYLKHSPLSEKERRSKYQTIFAKHDGSIAAPTASLHFTRRLFKKLRATGVETAFITLHVNLGTFMPLTSENVASGQLHEEKYSIPSDAYKKIERARKEGRPIIPVGTTALRALESAYSSSKLRLNGPTRLFIQEGFKFKVSNGLITNFHVPRSSLMMLVSALVGRERLLQLYAFAREHDFRFFSFGDGMLIR